MNKINKVITARSMSLGLILVLAGLICLSTLIPQEIDSTPGALAAWRQGHSALLWLIDLIRLHDLHAQPWFAAIILLAALSLGISSCDQLNITRKKLYGTGTSSAEEVAVAVTAASLESVARSCRYHGIRVGGDENYKFVKNPWGYFGALLLHVGMTLVILAALYISLTNRQGMLLMVEGEERNQQQPWNAYQHGLLASRMKLPGNVKLDKVRVRFDRKNQPLEVYSDISFLDRSGRVESLTASINRTVRYHGLRIYHAAQYGDAFTVTFTDSSGASHTEKIFVQQALDLSKAGYSEDFRVAWSPHLFDAKYFTDADRKNMSGANPELVLRMHDPKGEIARVSVTKGLPGVLGDYRVRLVGVEKWSKLLIVDTGGMSAVFAGFAIIMLGGFIHYMAPPRELIGIRQQDGRLRVFWRAGAFREFYLEECAALTTQLEQGGA